MPFDPNSPYAVVSNNAGQIGYAQGVTTYSSVAPYAVISMADYAGVVPAAGYVYQGPWTGRPSASTVAVGAAMVVTDVGVGGRSFWWSDGTNWRPQNGAVLLFQSFGKASQPLATITGNLTNQRFTLPTSYAIPGGLIYAGGRVFASGRTKRVGASGTSATSSISLTLSDTPQGNSFAFLQQTIGNTTNLEWNFFGCASFGSSTNFYMDGFLGVNGTNSAGALADVSTNVATPLYFSINIDSNFNTDTYNLYGYSVWYQG